MACASPRKARFRPLRDLVGSIRRLTDIRGFFSSKAKPQLPIALEDQSRTLLARIGELIRDKITVLQTILQEYNLVFVRCVNGIEQLPPLCEL